MAEYEIIKALNSDKSTIFFGNLGRETALLEYFLRPHVIPKEREWCEPPRWFKYNQQNIFIWPEPGFGEKIPHNQKHLVFSSHLDLDWDISNTDVIALHMGPRKSLSWTMEPKQPYGVITDLNEPLPCTQHIVLNTNSSDPHEVYLQMFQLEQMIPTGKTWSIALSNALKQSLKTHLERSWQNYQKFFKDSTLYPMYWIPPPW